MKAIDRNGKAHDITAIPDLGHAYVVLKVAGYTQHAEMVLECWRQAHAMRDEREKIKCIYKI